MSVVHHVYRRAAHAFALAVFVAAEPLPASVIMDLLGLAPLLFLTVGIYVYARSREERLEEEEAESPDAADTDTQPAAGATPDLAVLRPHAGEMAKVFTESPCGFSELSAPQIEVLV